MAFCRVIIIRKASITTARAMPSVPRVMVWDSSEIGNATLKATMTRTMPTSIVVGMLIRASTSPLTLSWRTRRCRIHGSSSTLSASVSPAE